MSSHDAPSDTLTLKLFFTTLMGKTMTGWFSPQTMGHEVFDWVAEKLDLPVDAVRIVSCGRHLLHQSFAEQNVRHESTFHVVIRLTKTSEQQMAEYVAPRTAIAAALAVAAMQDVVPLKKEEQERLDHWREMLEHARQRRQARDTCAVPLTVGQVEKNLVDLLVMMDDARRWRAWVECRRTGAVLRVCCPTCQRPW